MCRTRGAVGVGEAAQGGNRVPGGAAAFQSWVERGEQATTTTEIGETQGSQGEGLLPE